MSFQVKLMGAMIGLVIVVTLVVLSVTERQVEAAYTQLYEERYEGQIEAFLQLQEARMEILQGIGEQAAETESMGAFMRLSEGGRNGEFEAVRTELRSLFETISRSAQGSRRQSPRAQGRPARSGPTPNGTPLPLVCVIKGEGMVLPILGLRENGDRRRLEQIREAALKGTFEEQGILYVAVDVQGGEASVREVVVTPVLDDDGERLGTLLVGGEPRSVVGGRVAERMNRGKDKDQTIITGLALNGEFYGDTKGWDAEKLVMAKGIAQQVSEREEGGNGSFEIGEAGGRLRVHYQLLNEGSGFPDAYHIALYSLSRLDADLSALRRKALQADVIGLLLAIVLGYVFARALSVPVRELSKGTEAVARGELDVRVPVRSGDELGKLAGSFNHMAEGLAMKERYRSVLGKVADEAVAEALVAGELELGGEEIEVSILFCDIRGFTSMTENRGPSDVIALLNEHMTAMTEVVYAHKGVVDKFVGDEIMAIFGAPKTYGDDAANACRAALAMIDQRERLNGSSQIPVDVGIGIATGVVVAGCMGSETRLNYTVVGDKVNLASRLCSAAKAGEVVVDGETWGRTEGLDGREENVALKGFTDAVKVWRLGKQSKVVAVS
jgi:class 3 adenylate cyclase